MKIIAQNRKALYEYQILEKIEAGIALSGKEVRAIREGRANLAGSFAKVLSNELWLLNSHVGVVEGPERNRKLLVKKAELKRFMGKTQEKKLTLIPLRLYFKNNVIKVELGLGRGLKKYDKREKIKKRDLDREIHGAV